MAKVTSKLQVTVPKQLAQHYGIQPGDQIEWESAGDAIRVVPAKSRRTRASIAARRKWFDQATARQQAREHQAPVPTAVSPTQDRGWTRDELYDRDRSG